ncbi:MAG TPA: histidine phosphatase family protein [Steroidobacteraceae bacterium]|nr:histidine phosphatase family protein [Steroidobacteraceae bacterium]HNS28563.1 histidine phosphatase family protein [Steroidobacteraceae bacterium]
MATFVIVRHAQASFGSQDYDALSALGITQAETTGRHFASRGAAFDRVLVGPRVRHAETARRLVGPRRDFAAVDALDECGAGHGLMRHVLEHREGAPMRAVLERYLQLLEAWGRGAHEVPGCETRAQFGQRIAGWFDQACADLRQGEHVLVVTSAGVIALLVSDLLQAPAPAWGQLMRTMRNASISELLVSGGRRSLASFNSTAHLEPAQVSGI